jgi:orotidine-5'-phosphate decarboxylase
LFAGFGDMGDIVRLSHSIIPACDVDTMEDFKKLIAATCHVEGVGAYKVGFKLGLRYGLPALVQAVREHTDLPVIYDHQKAATDIPDMGKEFARLMSEAKVDAAILFPQAGPATQAEWTNALHDEGVGVLVGGEMTHPQFLDSDGGYMMNVAPEVIYHKAAQAGVRNFVVPGNKPSKIAKYKTVITNADPDIEMALFAPGFIKQKGKIEDAAKAAGDVEWHAIVGTAIYKANDMTQATKDLAEAFEK